MSTVTQPTLKQGGKLTVRRIGKSMQYSVSYAETPEEEEKNSHPLHPNTHRPNIAASFVDLAIKSLKPGEVVWAKGSEEAEFQYNQLKK